jgi:hypothetical protein
MRHSQNQCVNGARVQAKVIPAWGKGIQVFQMKDGILL